MVFKIICVGSIPAILEIFFYSSLKRLHINKKRKRCFKSFSKKLIKVNNNALIIDNEKSISQSYLKTLYNNKETNIIYNLNTLYVVHLILSPINYTNETAISGINYAKPQIKPLSFILPWVNNIKLTNISISSLLPLNRVSEFGSMNSFDNKSLVVFQAWVLLKFVKKNLKTFNKKKLLGLYPTSQS